MDEETKIEIKKIWDKIGELEGKGVIIKTETNELDIFEVQGDKVIVTRFPGKGNEEKTQNIALFTLLGYRIKLNQTEVLSNLVRENVAMNLVPLDNFGTYMKKIIPRYIIRIGKAKSNVVKYKLTSLGEAFVKKLLKEFIKNEESN
jgi:hypothetical protein